MLNRKQLTATMSSVWHAGPWCQPEAAIDGVKTDVIEVEENVHISCPAASDTTAWMQFDMGGEREVYKVRV